MAKFGECDRVLEQNPEKTGVLLLTRGPRFLIVDDVKAGVVRRSALGVIAPVAFVLAGAAVPAFADGPEPPSSTPEPAAVGELDGVEVAVAEALVPPTAPETVPPTTPPVVVASVDAPAERVAVGVVDGVEVGVIEPPVPTTAPAVTATDARVSTTPSTTIAIAAPETSVAPVVSEALDLVLSAWG